MGLYWLLWFSMRSYVFILHNMILYCVLWNGIVSHNFILRNMILYCVLWNNVASYKLILLRMIDIIQCDLMYILLWNNTACSKFILRNIMSYKIILRLVILCNTKQLDATLFHRTQYKLILGNMKTWDAILSHSTQYKIISRCATWIIGQNLKSEDPRWNCKTQYVFVKRNIRSYSNKTYNI